MSNLDADFFPTQSYRDPLNMPQYITTVDSSVIWAQIMGDWLLNSYVVKLDQEIVDDIPELKAQKDLINEIFNVTRGLGWCVVQAYKDDIYKVFSTLQKDKWLTETDPVTNKLVRIGIHVKWTDDLTNSFEDDLYFDDRVNENKEVEGKAYFFIWEKGNNVPQLKSPADSAFALADVNLSVLSLSIQSRQILATLVEAAENPYFYHFKYGEGLNPVQRIDLKTQITYLGITKGVGAKGSMLESVMAIENGAIEKCVIALDEIISLFASNSRLPLSFYLGEKQTGGLGDTGEKEDDVKIWLKKQFILDHFSVLLTELMSDQFGVAIQLDTFYTDKIAEKKKKDEEKQKDPFEKGLPFGGKKSEQSESVTK